MLRARAKSSFLMRKMPPLCLPRQKIFGLAVVRFPKPIEEFYFREGTRKQTLDCLPSETLATISTAPTTLTVERNITASLKH
jgi:hypothetical protein